MLIRSGLVGMAVLGVILAAAPEVAESQGRAGGPAPSPAGRYADNGDDTITDTQTGLMWEKKTTAVGSGTSNTDIRDVDNTYTWEYSMNDWIDRLNGRLIAFQNDGAFAGHSDWRLPTMQELQTIVEPQAPGRINAAFGANAPATYWTASRRLFGQMLYNSAAPPPPWYVTFGGEIPVYLGQPFNFHVRAVRNVR